jgi:hypothetical protein
MPSFVAFAHPLIVRLETKKQKKIKVSAGTDPALRSINTKANTQKAFIYTAGLLPGAIKKAFFFFCFFLLG